MNDQPLLLEIAARRCRELFRENRLPFLSTLFIGLLCYMYAFTNKLLNHDEVQCLFLKGATVDSGRWGLGALDSIFPNLSMPWIYGVISIVLISAAVCLMLRILAVRSPALQVLLGGCVMAFPSLIGTFAYMFTSSSFALSFLMAVLAVWLLHRSKPLYCLLALGCMVFSLSIYQSYISLAAGLLVVSLIRRSLRREPLGVLIPTGVGYVVFLAAALGIYYGATQLILVWKDVAFNAYAAGNMGFSLAKIPASIAQAYSAFDRFFTEGFQGLMPTSLSRVMHLLCLLGGLLLLFLHCLRLRSPGHILLTLALAGILPLAINCMYLFTTAEAVHTLVLYGFVTLYALLAVLADNVRDPGPEAAVCCVGKNLLTLAMAAVIVCNIYLANGIWLNLQLRYENAYAFYTSILSDIRALPEFGPDSRIALIGDYRDPAYFEEELAFADRVTGTKGFLPDSYSRERFLEYYIGVDLPFATEQEVSDLTALPQVEAMPPYPYHGSVAAIGSTVVVKLS